MEETKMSTTAERIRKEADAVSRRWNWERRQALYDTARTYAEAGTQEAEEAFLSTAIYWSPGKGKEPVSGLEKAALDYAEAFYETAALSRICSDYDGDGDFTPEEAEAISKAAEEAPRAAQAMRLAEWALLATAKAATTALSVPH